jgi:glycosyltransferase involved in cell wall biosynthesis
MAHDIWLHPDANYDTRAWAVKKFAVLSDWHRDFFCKHHKVDPAQTMLTANGVREELYADVDVSAKKNRAVYSSSPDRGLYQLLQMVPRIREQVPDFELIVDYGYTNWEAAAKVRNNPAELKYIAELKVMTEQPGVLYCGRVNKVTLAKHQKEAKLWLYPTVFTETFGITAVEAGFAKNAVVTTPLAGLLTTLGDSPSYITGPAGVPIEQWAMTAEYQDAFVAEAVKMLKDEPYRHTCAEKVHNKVKGYTWKAAAEGWLAEWSKK